MSDTLECIRQTALTSARMDLVPVPLVDGVRRHPYADPDMPVDDIDASRFIISNFRHLQGVNVITSNNPAGMSRLGLPNVRTRTLTVTLLLRTQHNSIPTLATSNIVTISMRHQDDNNDVDRLHMATRSFQQAGSLGFHALFEEALVGPRGVNGRDIRDILRRTGTAFLGGNATVSLGSALIALGMAFDAANRAMSDGRMACPPAIHLIEAWRYHILSVRRLHIQRADDLLGVADHHVERFAANLVANGATMTNLRPVCLTGLPTPERQEG